MRGFETRRGITGKLYSRLQLCSHFRSGTVGSRSLGPNFGVSVAKSSKRYYNSGDRRPRRREPKAKRDQHTAAEVSNGPV